MARVCAETLVVAGAATIRNRSVASEGSDNSFQGGPKGGPVLEPVYFENMNFPVGRSEASVASEDYGKKSS